MGMRWAIFVKALKNQNHQVSRMGLSEKINALKLNEKQTEADLDDLLSQGRRIESLEPMRALSDAWAFIRPFKSSKADLVAKTD